MRTRLWLAAVLVFCLAMGVWWWRSELSGRPRPGGIPPSGVWQKILSAPHPSNLEIRLQTNVIGHCRWQPGTGLARAGGGFALGVEGSLTLPDFPLPAAFSLALRFDTNHLWQSFAGRATMLPDVYEFSADAAAQTARLRVNAGDDQVDRTFRFAEFQNPRPLLEEFGGPMLPMMLAALGVPLSSNQLSADSLGLRWEASHDSILVGGNRVPAYRLEMKPLGRYKVTLFISPFGELLRAELPYNIVLVRQAMTTGKNSETQNPNPK